MPDIAYKERITETFRVLMSCAQRGESIAYGQLAGTISVNPQNVGPYLDLIVLYCRMMACPDITVLAVRKDTDKPGTGYWGSPELIDEERAHVFGHHWHEISPTSIVDVMDS